MANPLVLTFDCGTQSMRAMLIDKEGNILYKAQKYYEVPYYSLNKGWAEQKPDFYWDALCRTSLELKEKSGKDYERVAGMSLTAFRDSCLLIDENREPVRDLILWADQRLADCDSLHMPFPTRAAFWIAGMTDTLYAQRKVTKANWLIVNEPENWKRGEKYVVFSAYLNLKLTGRLIDTITNQVGHIPIDYKSKKWKKTSDIQYPVFNIPPEKLIDFIPPCETLGYVTKEASIATGIPEGLPVISSGADKSCETLGCGVLKEGEASISFGTAATIQFNTKKYVEPSKFLPAYPAINDNRYNPEVQIYRGYWMVSWFKKHFGQAETALEKVLGISAEEQLNSKLNEIPVGCDGLVLTPYWSPTLKNPEARGSMIGFTDSHTHMHIYRAIIEGIGFGLLDGMRQMEKRSGKKITFITVSGGGSQSDVICQMTADMFGVNVHKIQTYEASGLGCAMACFVALKEFNSFEDAKASMVHYLPPFVPNKANHEKYNELFKKVYLKIYKHQKKLFKALKAITFQE